MTGGDGAARLIVGLAIGAGAIYAVASSAGGFADSVGALSSASPSWLVTGGVAEAASFVALGLPLRRLLGGRVNRRTAARLGLVVAGLGNVLPAAPLEGWAMASAELRRRGVDARQTRIALGLVQWMSFRTLFGVAALDGLAVAAVAGRAVPRTGRRACSSWAPSPSASWASWRSPLGWPAGARRWSSSPSPPAPCSSGGRPRAPRARHGTPTSARPHGTRRSQAGLSGLALLSGLADATCFRCAVVAVGVHLMPGMFLFRYSVAMIAAMVPLVPAGLGVVESVVPALLHLAGIPLTTALAGVLAYRALGTLLPAVFGTTSLVRLRTMAIVAVPISTATSSR